jgi:hypothetical protein
MSRSTPPSFPCRSKFLLPVGTYTDSVLANSIAGICTQPRHDLFALVCQESQCRTLYTPNLHRNQVWIINTASSQLSRLKTLSVGKFVASVTVDCHRVQHTAVADLSGTEPEPSWLQAGLLGHCCTAPGYVVVLAALSGDLHTACCTIKATCCESTYV